MGFTRGNNPKDDLGIGNKYSRVIEKLIKSFGDLPFFFKHNKSFQKEFDSVQDYQKFVWVRIGSFKIKNAIPEYLHLEVNTYSKEYVMRYNSRTGTSRGLISKWYELSAWQKFYNLVLNETNELQ